MPRIVDANGNTVAPAFTVSATFGGSFGYFDDQKRLWRLELETGELKPVDGVAETDAFTVFAQPGCAGPAYLSVEGATVQMNAIFTFANEYRVRRGPYVQTLLGANTKSYRRADSSTCISGPPYNDYGPHILITDAPVVTVPAPKGWALPLRLEP